MKLRQFSVFLLLTLFVTASFGQKSYYTSVDGVKGGATLKTALYNLIKEHKKISYGSGSEKTWGAFYTTDAVVEDGRRRVLDMYSNEKRYFGEKGESVSGMNIEHSVAKSWWGGTENNAYCDLHHLNPSDAAANNRKSNYPLSELTSVSWENGVTFVGKATIEGKSENAYEPCDEYKGDFARVFMYMFTCYQDLTWEYTWMNYEKSTYPTLKPWAVELLLKWHKQDPVSKKEVDRNNAVYAVQGNRNPFIDYPQLAHYVWGDSVNYTFRLVGDVEDGSGNVGGNVGGNTGGNEDESGDEGNTGGDEGGNGDDNTGDDDDNGNTGTVTPPVNGAYYLVTDASTLAAGDRLLIVSTAKGFTAGELESQILSSVSVVVDGGMIEEVPDGATVFTLGGKAGAWTLANADGQQLGATAVKKLAWDSGTTTWTIEITDSAATIYNTTSSYGRVLYNVNSPRFTTYTSNTSSSMLLPEIYRQVASAGDNDGNDDGDENVKPDGDDDEGDEEEGDDNEDVEVITGTLIDCLTREFTGVTGNTYVSWSDKKLLSGAVYAGMSAASYGTIQLRSDKSTAGIITTKSGGKARKISVEWNENTQDGRTLDIYGSNVPYTSPTDLYAVNTQGTLLGSIERGGETAELLIEGDYEYIGLRSRSGAMYLSSIEITWEQPSYTLSVSDACWATAYLAFPASLPAAVNAYIVTGVSDGWLMLEEVNGVMPANTGFLVNAPKGKYSLVPSSGQCADVSGNLLDGTVVDTDIYHDAYILHKKSGRVGFYKVEMTNGYFMNNANRAFLPAYELSSTDNVSFYGFRFGDGDNTTEIEKVENGNEKDEIFDLSGRRVNGVAIPGVYIVNGKRVLVK